MGRSTVREVLKESIQPAQADAATGPLAGARLLYATSARIGGSGLDSVAYQSLLASQRAGFLAKAIAYDNRQEEIPDASIRSLRFHPVRLFSFLDRSYYYGAKKQYVDLISAREIGRGGYNLFHGWSGDCLHTLRAAERAGIPSLLEIPTWHRDKGKLKKGKTPTEIELETAPWPGNWLNRCLISRQRVLEEYRLASLILVLSEKAIETFTNVGFPPEKLFKLERGVDVQRFKPAPHPEMFRAIFVGSLIRRKGVHLLLEAWHRLALKDAELLLVGTVHDEIKPYLERFGGGNVKVAGFSRQVEDFYRQSCVQIFPSLCEGSAKATYEAAACGLAQIATRESGDVVIDGENGLIIPAGEIDPLVAAIERLYRDRDLARRMGEAGRRRVAAHYTWDHFRARLLEAYQLAWRRR